jgi:hypothetical protein
MDLMNNKDMVVMVAGYGDLPSGRCDFTDLNDQVKQGRFELRKPVW